VNTLLMTAPTRGSSVTSLWYTEIKRFEPTWADAQVNKGDSLEFVPLAFATQKPTKKTNLAFDEKKPNRMTWAAPKSKLQLRLALHTTHYL
jgi:hypothetical protein